MRTSLTLIVLLLVGSTAAAATKPRHSFAWPLSVAVGGNMGQGAVYVFAEPAGGWSSETETQKLIEDALAGKFVSA